MKYQCPCCGFKTLTSEQRGSFEICPVCYWEDDKVQLKDPDYAGGANSVSLREAQAYYKIYGACDPKWVSCVRKPEAFEK